MFFRGRFFMRTFLLLLLLGIFMSVAGRWSYNAGWSDGYVAAQTTAQNDDGQTNVSPPAPQAYPYRGWGFGPLGWFFGGLLKFWLFLVLVGLGLKLLGWGRWGRHWHEGRRHHHWRERGEYDAPREKRPEDVEPDVRSV